MFKITLDWHDPIGLVAKYQDERYIAFLYSSMQKDFTGAKSYLAIKPTQIISSDRFQELEENLNAHQYTSLLDRWFGYLSYDLKNEFEDLTVDAATFIEAPKLFMIKYDTIFEFDHERSQVILHAANKSLLDKALVIYGATSLELEFPHVAVNSINSNMSAEDYFAAFNRIMQAIHVGDIYEANLTRKFFGEFTCGSKLALFRDLMKVSPTPYGAYLKFDDLEILSSSPEQFLNISPEGFAEARPIKGTAKRSSDPMIDAKIKDALYHSVKDRAENLMIVDLMRNDFARSCEVGTVTVENLFEISTYATIHHMSSTILGQKRDDITASEFIKRAFPPGSMTGCPKIMAMEICSEVEKIRRGVYSGAIGYIGEDGTVDLSVVIRTLIINGNKFEFQVGGAIVADSTAEEELAETYAKAAAILKVLNVAAKQLETIV